jgi:hypothetical protein
MLNEIMVEIVKKFNSDFKFYIHIIQINVKKKEATSQGIIYKTKGIFTSYSSNLSVLHNILLKCLISLSFQIVH